MSTIYDRAVRLAAAVTGDTGGAGQPPGEPLAYCCDNPCGPGCPDCPPPCPHDACHIVHALGRARLLDYADLPAAAADPAGDARAATAEFLTASVAYWRGRAARLERAVTAHHAATSSSPTPPEPPVDTELWHGAHLAWVHRTDGWYCPRPSGACANCPATWAEVWDIGGIRDTDDVRWVLPGADPKENP